MMKEKYVAFHIGRGGRFHNAGHKSFYGEYSLQDLITMFTNHLFLVEEDERGNKLSEDKCYIHDGDGNAMLKGSAVYAMTGVLDFDGEYDTYTVLKMDELDSNDWEIVYRACKKGEWMSEELKEAAVTNHLYPY